MVLNSSEIEKIIPHRYPFLLIDRVDELEIGKRAKGIKCVTVHEAQFLGHFPDEHVMPGVLIVESLAQIGAVALLSGKEYHGKKALLTGIKNCKFRRKVIPGDKMVLEAELIKMKGPFGTSKATATVDGELACECEFFFTLQD
ncbi:MAG TPA: 3-hydroxyacyl-ACP dehydratase FabZ [Bacilli bacterium]